MSDEHLGCPAWPNCDEDPLGCWEVMGSDVEWAGHRDHTENSVRVKIDHTTTDEDD